MLGELLPSVRTAIPGPKSRALVDVLARHECPAVTARRDRRAKQLGQEHDDPIVWEQAAGANVVDADGNVFVDLIAGFGVATLGHRPPEVLEAASAQQAHLLHAMGDVQPADVKAWKQGLKRDAESAAAQLKAFDPALESGAQATEAKMEKLLDRLEQQVMRSAKRKEGDGLARIARLDAWCRPDGALQERTVNFFHLAEMWQKQGGDGDSLRQTLDLAFLRGHEIGEWRPLMHVIRQQEA